MLQRILVVLVLVAFCASWGFGMSVPSAASPAAPETAPVAGGRDLSQTELILVVVGAVLGTIILLAIID